MIFNSSLIIGSSEDEDEEHIEFDLGNEPDRDYEVFGVDLGWHWNDLEIRGEYVQQDINDNAASIAPDGGDWEAWYIQASYRLPITYAGLNNLELVTRYGELDTPHEGGNIDQFTFGFNYWFSPSILAKAAYEINDSAKGTAANADRWLIQLAYGF